MRRRAWPDTVVVLLYFGLSVIPYWDYWRTGGTRIAGKGGDPAVDAWFVDWVSYAVTHAHNPLITNWGNFPYGVNGVTNTSMPLLGLLGTPMTLVFGAFTTTIFLFTIAFPISALSAYLLLRCWVRWRPAAFAGGLLYGFSPYLVAQGLGHLNLVFVPLPPLIFLVLCRLVSSHPRRPWAWGAVLVLLCVGQFFISSEILSSTAVIAAIGLLAAAVLHRDAARERWRFVGQVIGSASVTAGLLLAYPLWLLIAGPDRTSGPAQETSLYRGNLLAPVIPDSAMHFRIAGLLRLANTFSANTSENGLYLGVPLLAVVIVGAIAFRRIPVVGIAAITTAISFVLALGSRLTIGHYVWKSVPFPEAALTGIPILDNTISVRYSLYMTLGTALILAVTMDTLHGRIRQRRGSALAAGAACAAVAGLAFAPLIPAWPYQAPATQVPSYFSSGLVAAIPQGSVAISYPFPSSNDAIPMLWQVAAGLRFRSPGGRFVLPAPGANGTRPSGQPTLTGSVLAELYEGHPPPLTPALRAALLAQWRTWRVRTVVVQPSGQIPVQVMPFFGWLLARPPNIRAGGIAAWYGPGARPRCCRRVRPRPPLCSAPVGVLNRRSPRSSRRDTSCQSDKKSRSTGDRRGMASAQCSPDRRPGDLDPSGREPARTARPARRRALCGDDGATGRFPARHRTHPGCGSP